MSNFIGSQEGSLELLQDLITARYSSCFLRLYNASYSPTHTDTLATYLAMECAFPGYTVRGLVSWSTPVIVSGNAYTQSGSQTFTRTSGGSGDTVYGWFLADTSGSVGKLIGAQEFATPVNMTVNGDTFSILPSLLETSIF